ncbi:MAG: WD40/YVTN/BNR-like repeat-containing protein, partial [Acidimicrobiales bacterium]
MPMLVGTIAGLVDPDGLRPVAHEDREVLALAGPWALLDGREVMAGDGRSAPLVEVPRITCLAEMGDGRVLAGTAEAHLYRLDDGHVERLLSFDDAETRDDWYTPWGGPPAVRSVAVTAEGTLLANVHVGGILRSA